ncbi:MAG TPA: class I SAM-dependent methyltransferase [Luteolibacter sp.]|nr:class I SAM-dependent methyltransferase [Luteolibacter sp.]
MKSPQERFSDRVENYIRHRPGYPPEIVDTLVGKAGLTPAASVADIGSGTGISAEMLLKAGYPVTGVEPNAGMRAAAERLLAGYAGFRSVDGSAQATTLPDHSVDLILAAQAFHWFDTPETRAEFDRILKPGGHVALLWNVRLLDSTPFLRDYEALLLEFGTDYSETRHENIGSESLHRFFRGPYSIDRFRNSQTFDYPALEGRLLSSSYAPGPDHPRHQEMLGELRRIFGLHASGGFVDFEYTTELYIGK